MCVTSPPYWGLRDYGICSCRRGRVQHESSTLVGSQAGTPNEFGPADAACGRCGGTGRVSGTEHIWGGSTECAHLWGDEGKPSHAAGGVVASGRYCIKCDAWFGSLGLEPEPELFIEHLVQIFHKVKKLLRGDGTLWVNIGDSYAASGGGGHKEWHKNPGISKSSVRQRTHDLTRPANLKPKDLTGIPWMLAFALRADGWYLRQDIIWSKQNPMPESVKDRCTKSHEYLFLLSKSEKYYFDSDAIKEDAISKTKRGPALHPDAISTNGNSGLSSREPQETRNRRSVWHLTNKPFKGAHFATFPPALVEIPILAGSKPGDTILDPFSGAATTGLVATLSGREFIGIEQNPEYNAIAEKRLIDANIDTIIF